MKPLPTEQPLPSREGRGGPILLIEDDPLFARLMMTLLEQDGHPCDQVGSGAEAIDWLRDHRPRLVVTDYQLPDMTAAELAARVHLPPFIVTTGAGSEQVAVNMMKLGARDYLNKDATFVEALPRTLARVLRELDVEDRLREAERISRESQERLRLVLEGSQDGFWDADLPSRTIFLSDHGWALLGAEPGSIALDPETLVDRVHPEDRVAAIEAVSFHLAGRAPAIEVMLRVGSAPQGWRWVLLRGWAVAQGPGGEVLRMAGTLGDASARKRMEENELRDRKMESLGLMAGGIAHDFNNLFQTLVTNLELMGPRFAGDARGRATLDRCFGILEKASALSRRMLDYSGGSLRAEEFFDLGALVLGEKAGLGHQLGGLNASVELDFQAAEGLHTAGDPGSIAQVLQTLVLNGAEALEGTAGRIVVSLGRHDPATAPLSPAGWVGEAQEGPALCLTVADTGQGIPAEHFPRIFDPFYSTKAHGRGLGLSAALGIIRSHGGRIHVDSVQGRGSTFRIFLPSAEAAEDAGTKPPLSRESREGDRLILLVDDEDDLRMSLAEILTDILSFRVIEARDGVEAVERYRASAGDVSLVIMDVTMPRMSGIQAWEEIRQEFPEARGILCSGYSEETGVQLATGHGFLGFLKKPFNLQTLRETIRKALPEAAV